MQLQLHQDLSRRHNKDSLRHFSQSVFWKCYLHLHRVRNARHARDDRVNAHDHHANARDDGHANARDHFFFLS